MSSILEALRELESNRPNASKPAVPVVEAPPPSRVAGAFIPIVGGLAVGVLAVGLYAWRPLPPTSSSSDAPAASRAATTSASTDHPAWLDTAEQPRARVNPGAAPPPAPERAVPERSGRDVARRAPPAPAVAAPDEPVAERKPVAEGKPAGRIELESIAFSDSVPSRAVTLRLDGRRVTLRQRESAAGVEVQLIMPNAVYVRRGADVFLVEPTR